MHLMNRVGVDIHEWAERVYGIDLRKSVQKSVLLVCGQHAMIFANAQLVAMVAVAGHRRFIVFFTRLEARVLEGMRHVARWGF